MLEECAALLMRGSQEGEDQSAHSASVVSMTEVSLVLLNPRCLADLYLEALPLEYWPVLWPQDGPGNTCST